MISMPRLKPARKSVATTTASSSASVLHGMRLLSNLMLSKERTKTLLMRSVTFLISLEMAVAPSMSLISRGAALRLRKRNFKLPWRKQKLHLNRRRIRFSGLSLSLAKLGRRLTGRSKRRRRSLTTPGEIHSCLQTKVFFKKKQ